MLRQCYLALAEKSALNNGIGGYTRWSWEDCFLGPFTLKPREMTYPAPTTSPCHTLSAHAEPITQGHCWIWHHELKVSWRIHVSLVGIGLNACHNVSEMIPGVTCCKRGKEHYYCKSELASIYEYNKPVLLQECNLSKNASHVLTVHNTMCKGKGLQ